MSMYAPGLFAGQVALVTGGGTGIGRATALELARLGAKVAICSRKPEHLEGTGKELAAITGDDGALWKTCDIREPEQVADVVQSAMQKFGRIDLLVNNAGGQFPSPAEQLSPRG